MPRRREGPTRHPASGFYFFDQWIGFPPNRHRLRYSLHTKDPVHARLLWEREWRRQWGLYYGEDMPTKPTPITFRDLGKEYISYLRDIKRIREHETARKRLNIVMDIWRNPEMAKIGKDHLTQLDAELRARKRSQATVNHYFGLLKAFWNWAIDAKRIAGPNPIKAVRPYIIDRKRRDYTADEITRILEAADQVEAEAPPWAFAMKYAGRIVRLLLLTGMRLGEVLNLKWDNVLEDRIILARTETKQKKEKVIPITAGVKAILDGLRAEKGRGRFVLPLVRAGRKRPAWSCDCARKIRRLSGIADFQFHGLRHTASTIMVSEALGRGVGMGDIMALLGHSRVETTMRYIHPNFDRIKKAAEVLEAHVKK